MGAGEGSASGSSPSVKPGVLTALLNELAVAPEAQGEPPWEPALRPGIVVGRFELLHELGRGSFGVVWEARDQELRRKVAFKLVRAGRAEAGADQLHREAEAVARLQHPNLVTLHDVGRCEHGPYLVLELLRGETLQARLTRGPLPPAEALAVALEVARGLAHAHAEGVVHRDLKPSNVFLCERGGVKLLDFGMAHAFGRKRVSGGTPAYMAPEQWRDAPEDERTDVFALGVMLYQMLTCELPFPDDGGRSMREPESAPELQVPGAPLLGPLVAKMLAWDPAERTRDGGAALVELERIAAVLQRDGPVAAAPAVIRRPRRRRSRLTAAIAAGGAIALGAAALFLLRPPAASSRPPSIAVLPFADLSPQHDQDYFSDGIAEEILDALAQVDGLRVVGRTSSFAFKGKNEDLTAIAQKLRVGSVLEGSVRKEGSQVRISAQLVNATDGFHLWSQTFDRELTSVFAIQDEIARSVVEALKVKLLPGPVPATAGHRTIDPEAHAQYLLGRHLFNLGSEQGTRRAVEVLERSVALDSEYAAAWAALSSALYFASDVDHAAFPFEKTWARASAAAERAIVLAPDLPEGYAVRAQLRIARFQWPDALADIDHALALRPAHGPTLGMYGRVLSAQGRFQEASARYRTATEDDPLDRHNWNELGKCYTALGRLDEARAALERALEISRDAFATPFHLGTTWLVDGHPDKMLELSARSTGEAVRLEGAALAHFTLGHTAEARLALERLEAQYGTDWAFQIAEVHAWRGEKDRAFAWLDRAMRQHDGGLYMLKLSPYLQSLRDDPRYAALLRKMNLPAD